MKKIVGLVYYFFFLSYLLFSQTNFKNIAKINTLTSASIDKNENILIADIEGNLIQYNKKGEKLLIYAPQKIASISFLEAWNTLQILAFYQDWQEFILFDRFLNPKQTEKINAEKIGFVNVIGLANDGLFWIFDQNDTSLKKYNPLTEQIIIYSPLELVLEPKEYTFIGLKEYQNLIFLYDKNCIFIFDNLGNYKRKIQENNIQHVSFWEDNMIILQNNNTLKINHLYTQNITIQTLPKDIQWQMTFLTSNGKYALSNSNLYWIDE